MKKTTDQSQLGSKINLYTSSLTASYDFMVGSISSFAMVYLLGKGFSELVIGNLIALANLLASLAQPIIADRVDRLYQGKPYRFILRISFLVIVGIGLVYFGRGAKGILGLGYLLVLASLGLLTPLHNSSIMGLLNQGYSVNFGLTRASGSLAFALISLLVGDLVDRVSQDMIILVAFIGALLYLLANTIVEKRFGQKAKEVSKNNSQEAKKDQETTNFFKKYPSFKYFLLGTLGLFISHNIINTYMFQIMENVGGGAKEMGFAISLAAVMDVPSMLSYTRIIKDRPHQSALKFSSCIFLVKAILTLLAKNPGGVYLAQVFQAGAFSVFMVASVYYTNQVIQDSDKVKGQSYLTLVQTLAGIIASSLGGWLINNFSVQLVLIVSVLLTIVGVLSYRKI